MTGGGGARRLLLTLTLLQSLGVGLFLASAPLLLVSGVGLTAGEVAGGLSIGGLSALVTSVAISRSSDRFGRRAVLLACYGLLGPLYVCYAFIGSLSSFVIVASLVLVAETAGSPLRSALTSDLFPVNERVAMRAQVRTCFNVGASLGALAALVPLSYGSVNAFRAVALSQAAIGIACAVLTLSLPRSHREAGGGALPTPTPAATTWWHQLTGVGLRDRRYLSLALVNGLLETHNSVLTIALPLWILAWTDLDPRAAAAAFVLNTVLVVALQIRLSRGAESAGGAAQMLLGAGVLLCGACAVLAITAGRGDGAGYALLAVGVTLLSLAEILQSASGFQLSFAAAVPGREGEYQGVFGLGRGLQQFVGPVLVTSLVVGRGVPGWIALGAIFATLGFLGRHIAADAVRAVGGTTVIRRAAHL